MVDTMYEDAYGRVGNEQFECMMCGGSGVEYEETCLTCGGFGYVCEESKVEDGDYHQYVWGDK